MIEEIIELKGKDLEVISCFIDESKCNSISKHPDKDKIIVSAKNLEQIKKFKELIEKIPKNKHAKSKTIPDNIKKQKGITDQIINIIQELEQDKKYNEPGLDFTCMLNELKRLNDSKSRAITYWSNTEKILKMIFEIKFTDSEYKREDALDKLVQQNIIKNNLRKDIDFLAEIRVLYAHSPSCEILFPSFQKEIIQNLECSFYVKTRNTEEDFSKYDEDRKTGLLCGAILSNLILVYQKLIKPELFDESKYKISINMFGY